MSCGQFKVAGISINTAFKTFEESSTSSWNPVLLMIGLNQNLALEQFLLTRTIMFLHLRSLFSKPYSVKDQRNKLFTQSKRVKRQAFALKIAIYNKNMQILKLLLDGKASKEIEGSSYVTE